LAADSQAPRAEEVVERFRQGLSLPGNLGFGDPKQVRFAIAERARGPLRDEIEADRESPRARLERYIVLRYPASANLESIRKALLKDPHVVSVEENRRFELAATPTDPMFAPANGSTPPGQYQWGSYMLNLPDAWDYTKGHAYVGTVDTGIDTLHPDLIANFRPHLSRDFGYDDDNVDEGQPQMVDNTLRTPNHAGHGTHVAGIIGATANNNVGVAGACWSCSLLIAKVSRLVQCTEAGCANQGLDPVTTAAGLTGLVDRGAQVANMSFQDAPRDCTTNPDVRCTAIAYATQRDVFMVAAAGNGIQGTNGPVSFPANDPRVLAAGGIIPNGTFWGTCDPALDTTACPSNFGADQEVVAPARQILSTFYRGLSHFPPNCAETTTGAGYGLCTGTSMASPFTAGLAALARSVNPLLSQDNVQTLLRSTASFGTFHDNQMGFGIPNALAVVQTALGPAAGAVLPNRLTPLFSFYSGTATDSFYTTVPQMASAAEASRAYEPTGPLVPGYNAFPGAPVPCTGCRIAPGASVYVFSGDRAPFTGAPPLVALYRLTHTAPAPSFEQDATYTVDPNGVAHFISIGYNLDGIEGYVYQRCTPEPQCIPTGAVRLYRAYNSTRDDWAIFPESELAAMQAAGYEFQPGFNDWIGYVYPTADTDGDNLINGFEGLIGTSPATTDADCDGTSDGNEVLHYPPTDPLAPNQCDQPPVAHFTANCGGRFCSFDGTGSTDDHGIVSWAWTFGDGGTGSGSTTSHAYATVGSFTVTLTVTDTTGHTHQTSQNVTTAADDPPHASFFVVCSGLTCSAESEGSSDDYGIVNYTWTWGDGQTTSGGSSVSAPSHAYAAGGSYTITLVVRDAVGQTATDSHAVSVGQPPTASFTISCIGRRCDVDGSASTAAAGIASYTWNWDDESSTTTTVPTTFHVYAADDTFTVQLIVTDANGGTAGASHTVSLLDYPPSASFYVGCNTLTCTADSEASGDDNGIVNYHWTWGDGQTTSGASSAFSAPDHTYASAGTYTITLVVTDISGQTASDSHPVTVTSGGPTVSFTISCVGRSCDTNASTTGGVVSYLWDWDDEDLTTTTVPTAHHNYPYGGSFTVRVTVTDANGNQAAASQGITIP
jgi:subtilisin family serine protease/PKD repeat protein